MSLVELFADVDDFCQVFEPRWRSFQLSNGLRQRNRSTQFSLSEIIPTIAPEDGRDAEEAYNEWFSSCQEQVPANNHLNQTSS